MVTALVRYDDNVLLIPIDIHVRMQFNDDLVYSHVLASLSSLKLKVKESLCELLRSPCRFNVQVQSA